MIFPYIGGDELISKAIPSHHRYVINFGDLSEETCLREWPALMSIIEKKVKPERDRLKDNADGRRRKHFWWQFGRSTPALEASILRLKQVLTCPGGSGASKFFAPVFVDSGKVFSQTCCVFTLQGKVSFCLLRSSLHESWIGINGATLEDRLRYNSSSCFETFPFPSPLLDSPADNPAHNVARQSLEAIGERYHQFRAELMVSNNEGLTSTYNRFHDPAETSEGILELRRLHDAMDQAVLAAYGWSDVLPAGSDNATNTSPCGFGLDYLDTEDDALLPPDLQERITSGDLFFPTASEACNFQAQLRRYGAVKPSKKLPWRHRWPDAIRDDVLARLLALNAERYAEEQAMGLHGKGGKSGGAAGGDNKRRARLKRNEDAIKIQQTSLALPLTDSP